MNSSEITLAKGTIHNPAEARHFMGLEPMDVSVTVKFGRAVIARSTKALRLMEVGLRMYTPVIYIPRDDVLTPLNRSERSTHCPLKGDCSWFSLPMEAGEDIAWSYEDPYDFAAQIEGLIAFDTGRVTIEEAPK